MAHIHIAVGEEEVARVWVPSTDAVHKALQALDGVTQVPSPDGDESYAAINRNAYNRFLIRIRT